MSYSIRQQKYLQKRLRVRALHQKGLTVSEIAKETKFKKHEVVDILNDAGLKPKFAHTVKEHSSFVNYCRKRVKI